MERAQLGEDLVGGAVCKGVMMMWASGAVIFRDEP
jgi:hypothetical protein